MAHSSDSTAFFEKIDLAGDYPDIDDVEGYVERANYYDRSRMERTYFYRLGNTVSVIFIPCTDVDCEGVYYVRDIIDRAYGERKDHAEGALPCCACKEQDRAGNWCRAKFSIDIKYKMPEQKPREGPTIPSPEDRFDLY